MYSVDVALRKWGAPGGASGHPSHRALLALDAGPKNCPSTDRRAVVYRAKGLDRKASIPIARRIRAYKITMVQANKLLSILIFPFLLYKGGSII